MTALFATSETDAPTMPLTTWSIDIEIVRRVWDELRSSLVRCGARAWPKRRRETMLAWAWLAAPIVSQSPRIERHAAGDEQAGADEEQDQRVVVALVARQRLRAEERGGDAGRGLVGEQASSARRAGASAIVSSPAMSTP